MVSFLNIIIEPVDFIASEKASLYKGSLFLEFNSL